MLPCRYPIFLFFLPGEREGFCAELSTFSHTSGTWEASMRRIFLIISRLEPRASSPHTRTEGDSVPGCTPLVVCTVVYPGGYGREAYTHLGIPPGYTGRHTLPVYPPSYIGRHTTRVYTPVTPMGIPPGYIHLLHPGYTTRVYTTVLSLVPPGIHHCSQPCTPGYTTGNLFPHYSHLRNRNGGRTEITLRRGFTFSHTPRE